MTLVDPGLDLQDMVSQGHLCPHQDITPIDLWIHTEHSMEAA